MTKKFTQKNDRGQLGLSGKQTQFNSSSCVKTQLASSEDVAQVIKDLSRLVSFYQKNLKRS